MKATASPLLEGPHNAAQLLLNLKTYGRRLGRMWLAAEAMHAWHGWARTPKRGSEGHCMNLWQENLNCSKDTIVCTKDTQNMGCLSGRAADKEWSWLKGISEYSTCGIAGEVGLPKHHGRLYNLNTSLKWQIEFFPIGVWFPFNLTIPRHPSLIFGTCPYTLFPCVS